MATASCTCAAPWRNMPIALRPARNSATSTFPSLLVSSLSNRSWYGLSLSASQHLAVGRKNLRMFWYIVALTGKQRRRSGCDLRIHSTDRLRRPAERIRRQILLSGVEQKKMCIGRFNFASRPVRRRRFPSSERSAAVEGGAMGVT